MPRYPNRTPFKRAVSGKITPKVAGDEIDDTIIRDANDVINTPAGTVVATDVQAAISELDNDATLIRNDIDYPTAVKQKAITDTGEDGGVEGGVFNGDFEYGSGSLSAGGWIGDEKYGWRFAEVVTSCEAGFDSVSLHGVQSMKISTLDVTGKANVHSGYYTHHPNYQSGIKPSTKYRFSGYVKTNNVATDCALIRCVQSDIDGVQGTVYITPTLSGDNDWTYIEKIFTSDADAAFARCEMLLNVAGNISDAWFDDIKLEQIDTQAVNTQVDEIVSVSVEGVTTTDNIDQYLETSGNTYTLTTGIDEGATHRQTFTPTADRGDGEHILTKIQALVAAVGTGDWTLVVHDAANNVLASTTVVNGSMSTGDIDFDVPAILDVGTAYHFHIYSTVADGTVTTTDNADLETVDFHAQFAKHTESPIIAVNSDTLDMTGVKLLTGATITVNADGNGWYEYGALYNPLANSLLYVGDIFDSTTGDYDDTIVAPLGVNAWGISGLLQTKTDSTERWIVWEVLTKFPITHLKILTDHYNEAADKFVEVSADNITWTLIDTVNGVDRSTAETDAVNGVLKFYLRIRKTANAYLAIRELNITANLDCQAALPIFTPSAEVTTEAEDLTQNPIDISEGGYWQLNSDLTGWGSRTFSMLASEAAFESQAVSANYIYMYDSNGTTPWTWDERSGLVPPADRTSGTVTAKFFVGDNQIRSSVNNGSMKANVNLSWNEESLRAAINRLTALANLQYPIVIEVEDVPAIDVQDQPTGASAETGYTNDVTSLRQTAAATPAIAYTGLSPRENQFSEWLDITVICSDGDGTLQGKLYTVDGTLIETYADLESNPVITISNPDYKYSRERLILQISASLETTSTAWSVTDIKWRYQYNG